MKVYLPVLTKYARHGGVTQFISNFITSNTKNNSVHFYDHSGPIDEKFIVNTFGIWRSVKRKLILAYYFLTFSKRVTKFDHVFLNPSLGHNSLKREIKYAKNCISSSIPFSVFFHGWDLDYAKKLETNKNLLNEYIAVLNHAHVIFVLASTFKKQLIAWGVRKDLVLLEKSMVNDDFLPTLISQNSVKNHLKLLYLSRIGKTKGIFEAIDAFSLHQGVYPKSVFTVAGTGPELSSVKEYVVNQGYSNIDFFGFADEKQKKGLMSSHDVFILPSYTEGMPISIFEAMAFGLTIITRPVGGIPDYFKNNEMGFLIESLDPKDYSEKLNFIAEDITFRNKVALTNRNYVESNVISSVVTENILNKLIKGYANANN